MSLYKIYATVFLLLITSVCYAQSARYESVMRQYVPVLDTATSINTLQTLSNTFERIATSEKNQWMPYYYAGYCVIMQTYNPTQKKDVDDLADKAEAFANKADSLSPNNSEVLCLMAMVNSGRIMANPMTRGKKYGTISNSYLQKAEALNADNPRIYYLRGAAFFHTPKAFGGGKDKAKPLFQQALDKYAAFKPTPDYAPHWGEGVTRDMLKQCGE